MSVSRTYEQDVLIEARKVLDVFSPDYSEQLLLLEHCATGLASIDPNDYWKEFDISKPTGLTVFQKYSENLIKAIKMTRIPIPIALSSLAREPLTLYEKKENGVYYTDFRLANLVAEDCSPYLSVNRKIIDFAAGSGILLAALAEVYHKNNEESYDSWLSNCVYAMDMSSTALRGARMALTVYSRSLDSVSKMFTNWIVCDSLLSKRIKDSYFDIIVGNPPWGKIKATLHSFVNRSGAKHIYGDSFTDYDDRAFQQARESLINYGRFIKKKYDLMGSTEPDTYIAFLQKAIEAQKDGGHLAYLVPAGLIRSQGTEKIRQHIFKSCTNVSFTLLDNKPRFFTIDSRFKFLLVSFDKKQSHKDSHNVFSFSISNSATPVPQKGPVVSVSLDDLRAIRPDLTIPECRNTQEWELFYRINKNGCKWEKHWNPSIARELDMTNDKSLFQSSYSKGLIPVVEGRMVQNHRFGAKSYISGRGRSAIWSATKDEIISQFYIDPHQVPKGLQNRINSIRAGYCDIAGQTNERAMMSAVLPKGVICGNKVPTVLFFDGATQSEDLVFLWVGITNSFVFDWLIRRVISTTVNYFLLYSIPMPQLDLNSKRVKSIIRSTEELSIMTMKDYYSPKMSDIRSQIDYDVAELYGLTYSDMKLIMDDFPLLDRKQPPVFSEKQSTITRDLVLSKFCTNNNKLRDFYSKRIEEASRKGALAYIPSEMASQTEKEREA